MVKAELKYLLCPDIHFDVGLADFQSPDPQDFGLLVQAISGPEGVECEESFDFMACTPKWFEHSVERVDPNTGEHRPVITPDDLEKVDRGFLFLRHYLLLPQWDYLALVAAVESTWSSVVGLDWSSVAEKLTRYAHWEFENYRP